MLYRLRISDFEPRLKFTRNSTMPTLKYDIRNMLTALDSICSAWLYAFSKVVIILKIVFAM